MSDSVLPHRRQPIGLPCPWDSPGKNTGVGCNFLLQCIKVKRESEVAQWCPTLSDPVDCSLPGSSVHGIFQARVLEWGAIAFYLFYTLIKLYYTKALSDKTSSLVPDWIPLLWTQESRSLSQLSNFDTPGFLASRGEEFNPGPMMRFDHLELLCNKILLKYERDRQSFWQNIRRGQKECPPASL